MDNVTLTRLKENDKPTFEFWYDLERPECPYCYQGHIYKSPRDNSFYCNICHRYVKITE